MTQTASSQKHAVTPALVPLLTPMCDLKPDPRNARIHDDRNLAAIGASLRRFGQQKPIVVDAGGVVRAGNGLLAAAKSLGWTHIAAVRTDLAAAELKAYALADNQTATLADWDRDTLAVLIAELQAEDATLLDAVGFGDDLSGILQNADTGPSLSLCDRFLLPPFSVLDARQGYWQDRKRAWLALGLESEVGRGGNLLFSTSAQPAALYREKEEAERHHGPMSWKEFLAKYNHLAAQTGTSTFDPVLCEIAYRWFCPKGGRVLDPFAGGSVRGIVAARTGRSYTGIDLRAEQVEANKAQALKITPDRLPEWIAGDSLSIQTLAPGRYDFLFTCPPYADLEIYSDDPRDLSRMSYEDFLSTYRAIIAQAAGLLAPDRFAAIVVANVRGPDGFYRDLVGDTILACEAAGLRFYNDAILVTALGSLPIRVREQFEKSRKLGKGHQNVLVFRKAAAVAHRRMRGEVVMSPVHENLLVFTKGDPSLATASVGPVEIGSFDAPESDKESQ
jgi:hypothetical protein